MHGTSGAAGRSDRRRGVLRKTNRDRLLVLFDAWLVPQSERRHCLGWDPVLVAVECIGAGMWGAAAVCRYAEDIWGYLGQCRPCRGANERAPNAGKRACAGGDGPGRARGTEKKSRRRSPRVEDGPADSAAPRNWFRRLSDRGCRSTPREGEHPTLALEPARGREPPRARQAQRADHVLGKTSVLGARCTALSEDSE